MAAKRELIAPNGDKRYVRRDGSGRFDEVDDVSRSLSADSRRKARTKAGKGQGDRGDAAGGKRSTTATRAKTKARSTVKAKTKTKARTRTAAKKTKRSGPKRRR